MSEGNEAKPVAPEMVAMQVAGITMDPSNNMPIVILRKIGGDLAIPIWIGLVEASAIATELEGVKLGRPMTHDLLKSVLVVMKAKLLRIEVIDLKENTFYARLIVEDFAGAVQEVDSRPSDAIALALRTGADIFVAQKVLDLSQQIDFSALTKSKEGEAGKGEKGKESSKDKWTQILENLKPEDFGKYKM